MIVTTTERTITNAMAANHISVFLSTVIFVVNAAILRNDKMSSIKVPRELQAVIYEHDDFKGDYANVDRDVRCFDKNWNDEVSSLRVVSGERARSRGDRPVYGGSGNRPRPTPRYDEPLFDNTVLQQVSKNTWEINERRRGVSQYQETSRNKRTVYLQNKYTDERIEIDMQNNSVMVRGARGGEQRFAVTSRNAVRGAVGQPSGRPSPGWGEPDTQFSAQCVEYFAYTNGKTGSVRFSTEKGVNKFQERGHRGRICHRGELVIEMGKRDFATDYTLEINGRKYKFASGEKETQYRNNWYRKVIKLQLGR